MENVIGLALAGGAVVAFLVVTGLWVRVKRIKDVVEKIERKGSER